ncbi:hypothetical protein BJY00DRAFT_149211 [Aspergillus carlsbadensis]|nr:hypothetical protein BJY00DRAFT_149211 [Aspergillus carlsbadensis]
MFVEGVNSRCLFYTSRVPHYSVYLLLPQLNPSTATPGYRDFRRGPQRRPAWPEAAVSAPMSKTPSPGQGSPERARSGWRVPGVKCQTDLTATPSFPFLHASPHCPRSPDRPIYSPARDTLSLVPRPAPTEMLLKGFDTAGCLGFSSQGSSQLLSS